MKWIWPVVALLNVFDAFADLIRLAVWDTYPSKHSMGLWLVLLIVSGLYFASLWGKEATEARERNAR